MIDAPIEFKPRPAPRAPFLVSLGAGVLFAVVVPQDVELALWTRIAVPLGMLPVIAVTLWLWRKRANTRIVVDDAGIMRRRMFGSRSIAWGEIESYRYLSVKQPIVAQARGESTMLGAVAGVLAERAVQRQSGAGGYFGLGYLELQRLGGGPPFRIGKDPFWGPQGGYNDLSELIELVVDELHQRLTTDDFAPFMITRTALRHGDGRELLFAQISGIHLAAGKLTVLCGQPPAAWSTTAMQEVHNSLLLLHRLVQRGVSITSAPEVFVPPGVLLRD